MIQWNNVLLVYVTGVSLLYMEYDSGVLKVNYSNMKHFRHSGNGFKAILIYKSINVIWKHFIIEIINADI